MADAVRSLTLTHFPPLAKVSDVFCQPAERRRSKRFAQLTANYRCWTGPASLGFCRHRSPCWKHSIWLSVSTSVAHLAGALGKPVWLLNRFGSEWRWLLDRRDSPWYPSVTIYRQQDRDEWSVLLQEIMGPAAMGG